MLENGALCKNKEESKSWFKITPSLKKSMVLCNLALSQSQTAKITSVTLFANSQKNSRSSPKQSPELI